MSQTDKLKQIILDAANDLDEFYCPSEYGLGNVEICKNNFPWSNWSCCSKCWAAAIEKAEQEEDREDD